MDLAGECNPTSVNTGRDDKLVEAQRERRTFQQRSDAGTSERAAYGAGGVGGAPPLLSPRHTPGMKPTEEGFIVDKTR